MLGAQRTGAPQPESFSLSRLCFAGFVLFREYLNHRSDAHANRRYACKNRQSFGFCSVLLHLIAFASARLSLVLANLTVSQRHRYLPLLTTAWTSRSRFSCAEAGPRHHLRLGFPMSGKRFDEQRAWAKGTNSCTDVCGSEGTDTAEAGARSPIDRSPRDKRSRVRNSCIRRKPSLGFPVASIMRTLFTKYPRFDCEELLPLHHSITYSPGDRNKRTTRLRFWHARSSNLHVSKPSGHA